MPLRSGLRGFGMQASCDGAEYTSYISTVNECLAIFSWDCVKPVHATG